MADNHSRCETQRLDVHASVVECRQASLRNWCCNGVWVRIPSEVLINAHMTKLVAVHH